MDDPRDLALGAAMVSLRVGIAAGRIALVPATLASRAPVVGPSVRRVLDAVEIDGRRTREETIERSVDNLLAGPLTEAVARKLVEHRVVERAVAEIAATGDLAAIVAAAPHSPEALRPTPHNPPPPGRQRAGAELPAGPPPPRGAGGAERGPPGGEGGG